MAETVPDIPTRLRTGFIGGGNGWVMLGVRLAIAFGLTAGLAWLWRERERGGGEER